MMKILITRHIGYHVLPAIVFQPSSSLLGSYMAWSVTVWWGTLGLMLIGPNDSVFGC